MRCCKIFGRFVFCYSCTRKFGFWIIFWDGLFGLKIKNINKNYISFSERNGKSFGFKVGKWYFGFINRSK